jgi:hypothetical protein
VTTGSTLKTTTKLSLKQVCYDRIVARLEVTGPLLALLIDRQLIAVDLLVRWLDLNTVQLVVYAVEKETEELLRVLLAVTKELGSDL